MRTMIFRTSSTDIEGITAYCVYPLYDADVQVLLTRAALFNLIPETSMPTYMVWMGEAWVDWITGRELERYLKLLGLDPEEWQKKIDNCDSALFLPGENTYLFPADYRDEEDPDGFSTDLEQMWITGIPGQVHFSCNFDDCSQGLETPAFSLAKMKQIFYHGEA